MTVGARCSITITLLKEQIWFIPVFQLYSLFATVNQGLHFGVVFKTLLTFHKLSMYADLFFTKYYFKTEFC